MQSYEDILAWWQGKQLTTRDDFQTALENFRVVFTTCSNNIEEGKLNYHTTREVFEDKVLSPTSGITAKDIFDAQNSKFAFTKLAGLLAQKTPMSIDMILNLHRILIYGTYDEERWRKGERPGVFKKHDYGVGMTDEGSYPEDVVSDLQELLDEVNNTKGDILTIAAYFHLHFEQIHPFADGNGRLGRLLLCYYLMLNNYPPVNIFPEDKETYCLALEIFDRTENLDGFLKLLKEQTVKTWARKEKSYTLEQIMKARELAPDMYKGLSDDELWERVGNYIK